MTEKETKIYQEGFRDGLSARHGTSPTDIDSVSRLIYTAYRDGFREGTKHPDGAVPGLEGITGEPEAAEYCMDPPWYVADFLESIEETAEEAARRLKRLEAAAEKVKA